MICIPFDHEHFYSHSLGSISYLFKLCGSILSSWIVEPIGRQKAMIVFNIPFLVGWWMLYSSISIDEVFAATAILGFGEGLVHSPCSSYVCEIRFV